MHHISARLGIIVSALADNTSFTTGNQDLRFCTTTICFLESIGPNTFTATASHHFL